MNDWLQDPQGAGPLDRKAFGSPLDAITLRWIKRVYHAVRPYNTDLGVLAFGILVYWILDRDRWLLFTLDAPIHAGLFAFIWFAGYCLGRRATGK